MPTATIFRVGDLRPKQVSAIKQKAHRLGVSPDAYVKQLIEDDLELDHQAQSSSLVKLAKPFQTAFKNVSEHELDRRVAAAPTKHRRQLSKRKS